VTVTSDPDAHTADDPRDAARAQGRTLLEGAPWAEVADRAALLLTDPPAELDVESAPRYWLIVERDVSRSLPANMAQPLYRGEAVVLPLDGAGGRGHLEVLTLEGATRLLDGVSRGAIEARWRVRHAQPLVDRLRLHERLSAAAAQLPSGAPERVTRTLWLEAHSGLRDLAATPAAATAPKALSLVAAGETRGALERLACFLDAGAYPPARYLDVAAATTALGQRLVPWFDGLAAAAACDEAAVRRTTGSLDQVREEVRSVVRLREGTYDWLTDPDAYLLRSR
jgi:hypothetical protein